MEKQLLFLLDYDLAINEEEIVESKPSISHSLDFAYIYSDFQPFLSQYSFDSPVASTSSPVLPPTPPTPVRAPSQRRHRRVASRDSQTFVAPPLDRSGSSSSLESNDMPLTPAQSSSPPTPHYSEIVKGKSNRSTSAAHIQKPPAVYNAPTSGSYSLPRSMTSGVIAKAAVEPSQGGFISRFLRSDRRRPVKTRLEEEEEAVAVLSWTAI